MKVDKLAIDMLWRDLIFQGYTHVLNEHVELLKETFPIEGYVYTNNGGSYTRIEIKEI